MLGEQVLKRESYVYIYIYNVRGAVDTIRLLWSCCQSQEKGEETAVPNGADSLAIASYASGIDEAQFGLALCRACIFIVTL